MIKKQSVATAIKNVVSTIHCNKNTKELKYLLLSVDITLISSACSSYAMCKQLWPTRFWGMLGYDSYNLSDGGVSNWLQTQAVRIIFYSLNSQIPAPHIQSKREEIAFHIWW